jgi:transketolase
MLLPTARLRDDIFSNQEGKPTRDGFGAALLELGETNKDVVVVCADLAESTRVLEFKEKFPDRYVEVGVAEQNLVALASGLASYGKIPFVTSYATFSPGRNNEQIRTTVSINNVPVKVAGMHAGISVGPDGATHQALEDMALMRIQPNMTVLSPCDAEEARKATLAAVAYNGPVYLRFGREKTPLITTEKSPFVFGKVQMLWLADKPKVALFATGPLVHSALRAAQELENTIAVSVINVHTIKPLDAKAVVAAAKDAGAAVVIEEHQIAGGLGGAIAEVLAVEQPTPIEFVGVHDRFGQSGKPQELIEEYGMGVSHIIAAVKKVYARAHP